MQIKTCQDCDQLRPFTVKRTCPAKNRANSDIIESFFQEDPCMDLASRLIWRCFIETPSNESARKSKFCQIIWVTFITLWFHEFFQLLSILSSSKILCRFFCQIIMGSPLNSNVPDGHSVKWSESDNEQPDIQAGGAWPCTNPLHTFPPRWQNVLQSCTHKEDFSILWTLWGATSDL